ncbi:MAG: tetratricopeptide repeat protein [Gammaproteobacteria bacterium]|nr:tetratricopeptide repeat protein [Gammaproteobacteria bacterium]
MKAPEGLTRRFLPLLFLLALAPSASRAQPGETTTAGEAAAGAGTVDEGASAAFDEAGDALRRTRDAFVDAMDFQAALEPAQRIVDRLDGTDDPRRPEDIARLARIQAELEDFESAELNYLKAIELLEQQEGANSINLLQPYRGLGRSYIRSGRFPEAVTVLEQAQHISQRNLGLYNVSQTGLIDDLTTAHLGLGDTVTAQQLQLERLENAVRRYGEDGRETIPFRYALASYYDQSRMREAAREQYEQVVELLDATSGATPENLLDPLRRLMAIELLLGDRDDARTRLAGLLDAHPNLPAAERAASLAALGDWAIAKEDVPTARMYYMQAHEASAGAPEPERDEILKGPQMLDFVAPLSPVDAGRRSRDPYAWGEIVLEFDVSADGRASNVETVAATPAGLMEDAYDRRIRETHFRPRLVDGEPRPTLGVRFTHNFRHYVAEDE